MAPPWRLIELSKLINSIDSILSQRRFNHQSDIIYRNVAPIYVCNSYKFVPLLPETLFHFPNDSHGLYEGLIVPNS